MKDSDYCELKKENCENFESCKYLIKRFGVAECFHNKKEVVESAYREELSSRQKMLSSKKFTTGDNYRKDLDKRTYKEAVIDVQAKEKREC